MEVGKCHIVTHSLGQDWLNSTVQIPFQAIFTPWKNNPGKFIFGIHPETYPERSTKKSDSKSYYFWYFQAYKVGSYISSVIWMHSEHKMRRFRGNCSKAHSVTITTITIEVLIGQSWLGNNGQLVHNAFIHVRACCWKSLKKVQNEYNPYGVTT